MGDNYKVEGLSVSFADFGTPGVFDDGFLTDTFENVTITQQDLIEQDLRAKHPDLQKAYNHYQELLKKYDFWEKITK